MCEVVTQKKSCRNAAQIRRVISGAVYCKGAKIPKEPHKQYYTQEYYALHRLCTVTHKGAIHLTTEGTSTTHLSYWVN